MINFFKRLYIAYLIHKLCGLRKNEEWFDYSWHNEELDKTIRQLKQEIKNHD